MPTPSHYAGRLALGVLIAALGCSDSGGHRAPVGGVVTLDGAPLTDAVVLFQPVGKPLGMASTGRTGSDGRFELAGVIGGETGALVGEHVVSITTADPGDNRDERVALPKERVPARYQGKLEFEVQDSDANQADFSLTSR